MKSSSLSIFRWNWIISEIEGQIQNDLSHVWSIKKHSKAITNSQLTRDPESQPTELNLPSGVGKG